MLEGVQRVTKLPPEAEKRTENIAAKVTPSLKADLEKIATLEGRKESKLIFQALQQWVERYWRDKNREKFTK